MPGWQDSARAGEGLTDLDKCVEEAEAKQQLLEGLRLLAGLKESRVADRVIQVALHQVGPQTLHTRTAHAGWKEGSVAESYR